MFDFNSLKNASKKAETPTVQDENLKKLLDEAISELKRYARNLNLDHLKNAGNNLVAYNKIKKTNPNTYFYLSHIFYSLNKTDLAVKYLKIAEGLNPNLKGINELKVNIINSQQVKQVNSLAIPNVGNINAAAEKINMLGKLNKFNGK